MKTTDFTAKTTSNPADSVSVDVPLLIRLLEYAREDAKTDMDLHNVAERLVTLSNEGRTLSMSDYDSIVGTKEEPQDYATVTNESLEEQFARLLGEDATAGATSAGTVSAVVSPLGQGPKDIIRRQQGYTNQLSKGGPVKVKK